MNFLNNTINHIKDNLPYFDENADRVTRYINTQKYSRWTFIFTVVLLCICKPSWSILSLTRRYFEVSHIVRHHIFSPNSRFHRIRIYHNRSFQRCLFWCSLCFVGSFYASNKDLLQITKRLGRVAVALMPALLFLTLRPSPLPQSLYLTLLPIHKWVSRIVVLASFLHSVLYIWYMYLNGSLYVKIWKLANLYGVFSMILFIVLAVTSLRKVRRIHFRLFYYTHYICTWLVVIFIHLHARPGVPYYTTMNCAILLYQIIYRTMHTSVVTPNIIPLSPTLTLVEFPLSKLKHKPILPSCHVRINIYNKNLIKRWFMNIVPIQHPFTIVSLPTDETVRLLIRNGNFPLIHNSKYYVTGAFEPILTFIKKPGQLRIGRDLNPFTISSYSLMQSPLRYIINAKRVLICVGGSAISFGLPLLRILNFNGVNVRFIWVSKDYRDLKLLTYFKCNFEGMEVYVSGDIASDQEIELDYHEGQNSNKTVVNNPSHLSPMTGGTTESSALLSNIGPSSYNALTQETSDTNATDEIDFTSSFMAKKKRSISQMRLDNKVSESRSRLASGDIFRKPVILEPPLSTPKDEYLSGQPLDEEATPSTCRIDSKIKIPSGVKVFYGRPQLDNTDYEWCLQKECVQDSSVKNCCAGIRGAIQGDLDLLSQVWVVAAGPKGLVNSTKHWATDGGLRFHEESFAI